MPVNALDFNKEPVNFNDLSGESEFESRIQWENSFSHDTDTR